MIFDQLNLFSDEQAITATAVSTNAIDLGDPKWPSGIASPGASPIGGRVVIHVTEDFATLTSLTIALQESSDGGVGDAYADKLTAATIPLADLTAGSTIHITDLPIGIERYVRLNYTVVGSNATAGKILAGIVWDIDANF